MPPHCLVQAVVRSTEKYFELLDKQRLGLQRYPARNVQRAEHIDQLMENSPWLGYSCNLAPHASIRSDTSAAIVSNQDPGREIEIRILSYVRHTGALKFISKEEIQDDSGQLRIDFRWIVKRCLEWFQNRGTSIHSIETISRPVAVGIPRDDADLHEQQAKAIRMMLTKNLSYVWGPPGTGKTNWVLAKAVSHCVNNNQKVLVLASTNLAVDNALEAVLKNEVDECEVLRIGIPTERFIQNHPNCCEARALQHARGQILSQISALREKIVRVERAKELQKTKEDHSTILHERSASLDALKAERAITQRKLSECRLEKARKQELLSSLEGKISIAEDELAALAQKETENDIEALEADQTRTIKAINALQAKLQNMGFLARWFSQTAVRLKNDMSAQEEHLKAVEATLQRKRKRLNEILPDAKRINAGLSVLYYVRKLLLQQIDDLAVQHQDLMDESQGLRDQIASDADLVKHASEVVSSAEAELAQIGPFAFPSYDEEIKRLQKQIEELNERLKQYSQELTDKAVLGMTLDSFIGLTMQNGLDVDRVFVDEAPYAPLAKVIPLLSLGCPIAMLGDHLQLPPICQVENDVVVRAYWAKPAIFLEDAFVHTDNFGQLNQLNTPQYVQMDQVVLTESYRFGATLAALLDWHIYDQIGLTGRASSDTAVRWQDCPPDDNESGGRKNYSEANAIVEYLKNWFSRTESEEHWPSMAVLTPYRKQVGLIRKKLREAFYNTPILDHVEVWNTHQAQGREWDWVLFSVSDTANIYRNRPYYSDSKEPDGKPVVNTTISRAKQELLVFLDGNYWRNRHSSILTDLINSSPQID